MQGVCRLTSTTTHAARCGSATARIGKGVVSTSTQKLSEMKNKWPQRLIFFICFCLLTNEKSLESAASICRFSLAFSLSPLLSDDDALLHRVN